MGINEEYFVIALFQVLKSSFPKTFTLESMENLESAKSITGSNFLMFLIGNIQGLSQ